MKKTGLRLAQVAAVVFAIGVSAWIVVMAQREASPTKPAEDVPASDGDASTDDGTFLPSSKGVALEEPPFLPSSKSMPLDPQLGEPEPTTPEQPKPAFLPSSKSMRLEPPVVKSADEAPPKTDKPAEAKKKPAFLPTSKSGFVPKAAREELEKKAKEAAEAARKAKGDK